MLFFLEQYSILVTMTLQLNKTMMQDKLLCSPQTTFKMLLQMYGNMQYIPVAKHMFLNHQMPRILYKTNIGAVCVFLTPFSSSRALFSDVSQQLPKINSSMQIFSKLYIPCCGNLLNNETIFWNKSAQMCFSWISISESSEECEKHSLYKHLFYVVSSLVNESKTHRSFTAGFYSFTIQVEQRFEQSQWWDKRNSNLPLVLSSLDCLTLLHFIALNSPSNQTQCLMDFYDLMISKMVF